MTRVLITGATGFVGRHLAEALLREGREVHLLVRESSDQTVLADLSGRPVIYKHDGSTAGMLDILRRAQPQTVFHLASCILSEHKEKDIEPLVRSNVLLGTQLLEASSQSGVKFFINTGTYWQHYKGDGYDPVALYAATKQAFEDILAYYIAVTPLRALTLTLFDTYGPRDRRRKLLTLLREVERAQVPLPMSPGEQLIDMVYIEDVIKAYLRAEALLREERPDILGGRFAVSTGRRLSLRDIVEIYQKFIGCSLKVVWGGRPYRRREVMVPWQGRTLPGWNAAVAFEEGLRLTLQEDKKHAR